MEVALDTLVLDPLVIALAVAFLLGAVGASALFVRRVRRPPPPHPDAEPRSGGVSAQVPAERPDDGMFGRLLRGLERTAGLLGGVFRRVRVDEELMEALEEALLSADVGVATTGRLLERLRAEVRREAITSPEELRRRLGEALRDIFRGLDPGLRRPAEGPFVVLVVGVNGSGKTTTIGKLAALLARQGDRVLLAAGDTFRAGAIEQLRIWSERSASEFVAHQEGADPAAVLHDGLQAAKSRGCTVVLCDTAGRLQSKKPLMEELGKVRRVVGRAVAGAPHETLLVLDATIGQNALSQARTFGEVTGVTGVVLTKLDGTAKGGVVVAVASELGLPVKFIGVGEQVDDLRPFDADAFVEALLEPR